jgi:spore coat protein A, manganese oxidase
MTLSRRRFLKLAGGLTLALPLSSLSTSCNFRNGSSTSSSNSSGNRKRGTVTPFAVPLPIPPVLQPTSTDATTDYYDITQKEGQMEILPGLLTTVWGYNGIFPGPTIEARRGRQIVVRHKNELSVPTTTHLHGGRTPPESDGYPTDLVWPANVDPRDFPMQGEHAAMAGNTKEFKNYTYPNEQRGATLWYHDHRDMFTGPQVYKGLAGFYLLRDEIEDALPLPKGEKDIPLMITDRLFNEDGSFFYPSIDPALKKHGLQSGYDEGVQGDTILVNGAPWPFLEVSNTRYRFRFLNASNRRVYQLELDPPPPEGAAFIQIGSDGGLLERPLSHQTLHIAQAERFDVVIDFAMYPVGTNVVLRNSSANGPTGQVMQFRVVRDERDDTAIPPQLSEIEHLDPAMATITRQFKVTRGPNVNGMTTWRINDQLFDPNRVEVRPRLGDIEIWEFTSETDHPMHIHLAPFQVLSRSLGGNQPGSYDNGWKDTVSTRAGERTKVVIRFDGYQGLYIFHCHNLEHEDMGMMDNFEVV